MTLRLILASASPRRRELLRDAGYAFDVVPADVDESGLSVGLACDAIAERLASAKAEVVADRFPAAVVLGADTVVELHGQSLGKPETPADADAMLRRLSGSTHRVITGIAVVHRAGAIRRTGIGVSLVRMRVLSDPQITAYVDSGLWQGKAGGYGIQDDDPFVERIDGSLSNIVGLPLELTAEWLADVGVVPRIGSAGVEVG